MKAILIATMIFSGGSALALQNETVSAAVNDTSSNIIVKVKGMFNSGHRQQISEAGIPYPCEEYLLTLTEEQQTAIVSAIDVINARYDWSTMTNEEIAIALQEATTELEALYVELGLEFPMQNFSRGRMGNQNFNNMFLSIKENGLQYPNEEFLATLTEEQSLALTTAVDSYNLTYDWATMTDEEIQVALATIRTEMQALHIELGIEFHQERNFESSRGQHGRNNSNNTRGRNRNRSCDFDDTETTDIV